MRKRPPERHPDLELGQSYTTCGGLIYVVIEPLALRGRDMTWKVLILAPGNDFPDGSPQPGEHLDVIKTSLFHWEAVRI